MIDEILNEEEGGGGESNVTAGVEKTELPIDMKRKRKEGAEDRVDEAFSSVDVLDEALQRGESRGRFYKDSHGNVHDDEGHSSADDYYNKKRQNKSSTPKHYHQVPFAKKDEAKKEGMRFDGQKKKWYHTDSSKSKSSAFKLHEAVEKPKDYIPKGHKKISKAQYDKAKAAHGDGSHKMSPKGTHVHTRAGSTTVNKEAKVTSHQTYSHPDHNTPSVWEHHHHETKHVTYTMKK